MKPVKKLLYLAAKKKLIKPLLDFTGKPGKNLRNTW